MLESSLMYHRAVAALGLLAMVFFAWLLSSRRRRFPFRVVIGGLATQIMVALLILKTERGHRLFQNLGDGIRTAGAMSGVSNGLACDQKHREQQKQSIHVDTIGIRKAAQSKLNSLWTSTDYGKDSS